MSSTITSRTRRRAGAVDPTIGVDARRDLRRAGTVQWKRPKRSDAAGKTPVGEDEVTLESKLLTAYAALAAGYPIECPVCSGPFTAASGCTKCGSTLS